MASTTRSTISNTTKEGIFWESIREYPERLVVISEGDSWFSYPLSSNLADFIEMMGPLTMLRLEKSGDEAREMLKPGGSQLKRLKRYLKHYRKKVQLVIFSGGGNDFLDENLPSLLIKRKAGMGWRDCINDDALAARMAEIKAAYGNLLQARDDSAPACQIVAHSYDYLVPSGRKAPIPLGLVSVGPWIRPVLKKFGIPDEDEGRLVVRHLVDEFWREISPLAAPDRRFHMVDSRGTLGPENKNWNDEIHPTHSGFKQIAEKWKPVLEGLFPEKKFE
jgi:lysophospholipase L1-like esterase